jgi:hypothetical protein
MLLATSLLFFCWSCHQFDAESLTYVGDPALGVDPSWNLESMDSGIAGSPVVVYKDKKYDGLFTRTLGWNGGDGVQSTLLPDGNAFWTFNDSFYGVVDSVTRTRKSCNFPRNSVMIEKTEGKPKDLVWMNQLIQTTDPNTDHYYQARTFIRNPQATLSDAAIEEGQIDQDYIYWAGDATVYNNQLQMLWAAVDCTGPNNSMRRYATCLVTYSLNGNPGDGNYLKPVNINYHFRDNEVYGYGSTLWKDEDGHTYLYCTNGYDVLVARTATHDLNSAWEYYVSQPTDGYAWQSTYPTAEEVSRSKIQDTSLGMPWVFKEDGYYYMVGQAIWFGREAYILRSTTPCGPFTDHKELIKFSDTLDKLGVRTYQNLYMLNLHPHLSRDGELVISTNTDTSDFRDNFNAVGSADFYRVYNWEKLIDD